MLGIGKFNLSLDDIRSVIQHIIEKENDCEDISNCNNCKYYTLKYNRCDKEVKL